jgi:hypothetical protein
LGYNPSTLIGARGFNTFIFNSIEDQENIVLGKPWLWGNTSLSFFQWHTGFDVKTSHKMSLQVKLSCFPFEFWKLPIFKILGDTLGTNIALENKTFMALICFNMDISMALEDVIVFDVGRHYFIQALDYKSITFHCSLCKSHGHLKISILTMTGHTLEIQLTW